MKIKRPLNIEFKTYLDNSVCGYDSGEIIHEEQRGDDVILTILLTCSWENFNLSMDFEYTQTINAQEIIEHINDGNYTIDFNPDSCGKFVKASVDPNNEKDIPRILEYSADTCSMGYDLSNEWEDIIKSINAVDAFRQLINTCLNENYDESTSLNDLLNIAASNSIIQDSTHFSDDDYYYFKEDITEDYPNANASAFVEKINEYVRTNFKPHDGDGLLDYAKNLKIRFFCND